MAKTITTHGVQPMNYHVPSVVNGSPVSVRQWMPPPEVNTRAVLQLTHGISEHSGRYDRFARFLAKNGFRVYARDLRGHGLSVCEGYPDEGARPFSQFEIKEFLTAHQVTAAAFVGRYSETTVKEVLKALRVQEGFQKLLDEASN